MVPFALGSDTGGSVRQPAAFCGVYGLKPTYGTISRYGLAAYASSLETIGVLSPRLEMIREVYTCIRGQDPHDQTSTAYPAAENRPKVKRDGYRIGVLAGDLGLTPAMQRAYSRSVHAAKQLGWSVQETDIPMLKYAMPAYYTIAMAEASANLARYTGIRYGFREREAADPAELVRKTRTEGFGAEVKLRILIGTYVLRSGFQDQYYIRAQKIRTLLRQELHELFQQYDLLLLPVFPTQAFPFGASGLTPMQQKVADRFTLTANLAALPALSIPAGIEDGLPAGIQLMAPPFGEDRLFHAAELLQEPLPPPPIPDQFGLEAFSASLQEADAEKRKSMSGRSVSGGSMPVGSSSGGAADV
jgi:aspartyl-tRNA(Asn)/glutamyl-tRNA(Gln) amidotransferase subunit A